MEEQELFPWQKALGLKKGSILIFPISAIPDGLNMEEYLKIIENTGTIPYEDYRKVIKDNETFLNFPYILHPDGEKIKINFVDYKKES